MLHTRTYKSRMITMVKQFMHRYTNCIYRLCSGLYSDCQRWILNMAQKLTEEIAERISAAVEQENITRPNERNIVKL